MAAVGALENRKAAGQGGDLRGKGSRPVRNGGKLRGAIEWFHVYTSLGGYTQAREADNRVSRKFWILLLLVGVALTINGIVETIGAFLTYKYSTTISVDFVRSIPFPSVTVCPPNRIHCQTLYDMIVRCQGQEDCTRAPTYCKLFLIGHCSLTLTFAHQNLYEEQRWQNTICDFHGRNLTEEEQKKYGTTMTKTMFMDGNYDDFIATYGNLTEEEIIEMAHQPNKMVKWCVFNNMPNHPECQRFIDDPTKIFSPLRGVCHVFNHVVDDGQLAQGQRLHLNDPGMASGLTLVLELEANFFLSNLLSPVAGFMIGIENATLTPTLSEVTTFVSAGFCTNIAFEVREMQKLPLPFDTACLETYPEAVRGSGFLLGSKHNNNSNNKNNSNKYSQGRCLQACYNDLTVRRCGCVERHEFQTYISRGSADDDFSAQKICVSYEEIECIAKVANDTEEGYSAQCQSICKPQCHSTQFQMRTSSAVWPNTLTEWMYVAQMMAFSYHGVNVTVMDIFSKYLTVKNMSMDQSVKFLKTMERVQAKVLQNFALVNVFFSSMNVETLTDLPEDTYMSLFNSLGGTISLYLGISLVSIFEIVELVSRILLVPFQF